MDASDVESQALVSSHLLEISNLSVSSEAKAPIIKRPTLQLPIETYTVKCPRSGDLKIVVQGNRSSNEVCILTAHDLGCNWKEFDAFLHQPCMLAIASRIVWMHLTVPGQDENASDLPASYKFPSLQEIANDIPTVLDQLNVSSVVLFGDGAGANILLRFGLSKDERVMGMVLINPTASAAGFMETHREKAAIGRRLSRSGISASVESRLATHHFGSSGKPNSEELSLAIDNYCDYLRTKINQKNLAFYSNAYFDRSNVTNQLGQFNGHLLLVAGAKSEHAHSAHTLQASLLRAFKDQADRRRQLELLRVDGVVSVLHEKPEKLAECLQYFLQGLGLLSGLTLSSGLPPVIEQRAQPKPVKTRSLSMVDYDKPRGASKIVFDPNRKYSES